jgi:hypothetical protein
MFYRFAIALGLLFIGVHVGREIARTKPVHPALRKSRHNDASNRKISLH